MTDFYEHRRRIQRSGATIRLLAGIMTGISIAAVFGSILFMAWVVATYSPEEIARWAGGLVKEFWEAAQ